MYHTHPHTQSWAWLPAELVSPSPGCLGDSCLHGPSSEHLFNASVSWFIPAASVLSDPSDHPL